MLQRSAGSSVSFFLYVSLPLLNRVEKLLIVRIVSHTARTLQNLKGSTKTLSDFVVEGSSAKNMNYPLIWKKVCFNRRSKLTPVG